MSVKRQANLLAGQRLDIPHIRAIESAVAADFDNLGGKIMASSQAIVVSGMTISMGAAVGNFATSLVLNTASSILLHGTASEPGSVFVVPSSQPAETLNTSNPNVSGSFTPNSVNYIGIDLIRTVDETTVDTVKFRSATTLAEFSQQVPLARTLNYVVVISTQDFAQLPNVAPVASVQLDINGIVQSVTDCRQLMFRLGAGGSVPTPLSVYSWPGGRVENPVTSTNTVSPFVGADKSIGSFLDFFHAFESRLWEVGGGEHWYSQTTDRDVLFVRNPASIFSQTNDNFYWNGTDLLWQGLSFEFGNSTAVTNTINNQTSPSSGLTNLLDGQCLYVDLNRAVNASALTMVLANLSNIGTPTIPGSRHIIAWRQGSNVYVTGSPYALGFAFAHASPTVYGVVELFSSAGTNAIVPAVDSSGQVHARGLTRDTPGNLNVGDSVTNDTSVTIGNTSCSTVTLTTSLLAVTNLAAGSSSNDYVLNTTNTRTAGNLFVVENNGSAKLTLGFAGNLTVPALLTSGGVSSTSIASNGTGVSGTGGTGNGIGVVGQGTGSGVGVQAFGGSTGSGLSAFGGASGGNGVNGTAQGGNGTGGVFVGIGSGGGVTGQGGLSGGTGVVGTGAGGNGYGVIGTGQGTGNGVTGTSGTSGGFGVAGTGAGANASGVSGTGNGSGFGVIGYGGLAAGVGVQGFAQGGNAAGVAGTGSGSGPGGNFAGGASNAAGVTGAGTGIGAGIVGTGGSTGGNGVTGNGAATGYGVAGTGGSTNGIGVLGTGGGNGVGVQGNGSGSGPGGFFTGGPGGNAAGVIGVGGSGGGGAGGSPGGKFQAGTGSDAQVQLVPQSYGGATPINATIGAIWYDSSNGHFYGLSSLGTKQLDN